MMKTVEFQRSSLAASASSFEARKYAPAAGVFGGCSSEAYGPSGNNHVTSASVPFAQSSSKAR